ncbi:hypothetical protein COLINT_03397 [Collinsella intestinalis DSM 13280]|uniref:Uncharacterized protein n=1 Tax=Collinsella intestinalis DSM 13280 TaxID=521003 RepID=C4FBE4_9ACTN|nr:hypothetical protein COLINT_03397 [Collinsella intestinalis DSM 13280]
MSAIWPASLSREAGHVRLGRAIYLAVMLYVGSGLSDASIPD